MKEVEDVVGDLKTASRRRDDEARRISDEVKSLKDAIPRALQGAREGNENRLKELGNELRSLKVLLGNRLGGGSGVSSLTARPLGTSTTPEAPRPTAEEQSTASTPTANGTPTSDSQSTPAKSPLSQLGRSASIPAWQMAAANRSRTASPSQSSPNTSTGENTPDKPSDQQQQQGGSSS